MFFSQDWRERVRAENPDAGFGEIGKLLGAKWKELDDEEKKVCFVHVTWSSQTDVDLQPYIEQAARDKDRAEKEKKDYDVSFFALSSYSNSPSRAEQEGRGQRQRRR